MAWQVKSFVSIVASMLNRVRATQSVITDFSIGGVERTMLEAPAMEIDELYQQMQEGLIEAIPIATFLSFNFALLTAQGATGTVRVTVTAQTQDVTIPQGSLFGPSGGTVQYLSTSPATIPAGSTYADVSVAAVTTGAITNLAQGASFSLTPQPLGFVNASNLAAFVTGADAETNAQRLIRFQQYIVTLARGTVDALKYAAGLATVLDANGSVIERVAWTQAVEPYLTDATQPVGYVLMYVHNGTGGTSAALVAAAQTIIDGSYDVNGNRIPGYKAAGVKVVVLAAAEQVVTVTSVLTPMNSSNLTTLEGQARTAIYDYIYGLPIGAPAYLAEIIKVVMDIPGVSNFGISSPVADVSAAPNVKLMPGLVTPS